jgi:hypothetical protein
MRKFPVAAPNGYEIIRHGGGIAYELIRANDRASVFLQGEDATTFEHEYEAACIVGQEAMRSVCSDYDDVMSSI